MYSSQAIKQDFSRAAVTYDREARIQSRVLAQVVRMLTPQLTADTRLLDAGCGTGALSRALQGRFAVTQLDIAYGMCRAAAMNPRSITGCGSVESLPFADASFDMAVCSLVFQWLNHPHAALAELYRVLNTGGMVVFTTFVEDTLAELKHAFLAAGEQQYVNEFTSTDTLKNLIADAGFSIVRYEEKTDREFYPDVNALLAHLRGIGASGKRQDVPRTHFTRTLRDTMCKAYELQRTPQGIPASWRVAYALLKK